MAYQTITATAALNVAVRQRRRYVVDQPVLAVYDAHDRRPYREHIDTGGYADAACRRLGSGNDADPAIDAVQGERP